MKGEQETNAIERGGSALKQVIEDLFQDRDVKNQLVAFVKKNGGDEADAEDTMHEGIRNLIMNVRSGKYKGSGSMKAYLMVICKNLWLTQFNRRVHLSRIKKDIKPEHQLNESPETHMFWNERATLLKDVLGQIGEVCKEILGLWSLGYSFKEIGEKTNKKEGAARKQKHSCFKKLMVFLKNNPALMNELKQLKMQ